VHPLDTWVDPADAFVTLFGASDVDAAWLDSGPEAVDGRSFIGTGTISATSSVSDGTVTIGGVTSPGGILDALRDDLTARRHPEPSGNPVGWWGRFGYEAGAAAAGAPVAGARVARAGGAPMASASVAGAPDASPGTKPPVDAAFLLVDRLLTFDHAARSVVIVAPDDAAGHAWTDEVVRTLGSRATRDSARLYESAHPVPEATSRWRHDDTAYLAAIDACRAAIRAGDAYQLCLTNQATARTGADPLAVHLRLRRVSPAPYGGFLRIAGESLVSSSPEEFLRMDAHGRVRTRPIKGTRPRGATVAADLELRAELEASEKERAENVMIVDLMRNDLGRVCEVGSVEVSHLLAVESYAQVHQLVSTVEGRLRAGLTTMDAVAACFPAGSMTGAPKLSAMRILHRLENGRRGAFAGCFGYLALDGTADLAMVIRSIHFADGVATIGAGGGITALSVPAEELEEVRVKARALFAAAGLSGETTGPANGAAGPTG